MAQPGPSPVRWATRGRLRIAALAGGLALLALPTIGARLVDVRIALHPGFTRVVFETDEPVRHELDGERLDEGTLDVRLDVEPTRRSASVPGARLPEVRVEPADGGALARIRTGHASSLVPEVLTGPPRIVVDLHREPLTEAPAPEVAAEPAPAAPELAVPEEVEDEKATRDTAAPEPPREPEPPVEVEQPSEEAAAPPAEPPSLEPEPLPLVTEAEPVQELPEPAAETDALEPPVSAAPPEEPVPAAEPPAPEPPVLDPFALDGRALLVGFGAGFLLGALLLALLRRRREPAEPEEPAVREAVREAASARPEPVPAPEPEPGPAEPEPPAPELAEPTPVADVGSGEERRPTESIPDLLRMYQGVDRRLARLEETLREAAERGERTEAGSQAQAAELRAQRIALARLQRWLRQGAEGAAQRAAGERSRPDQGAEGAAQRAAGERSRPDQGAEGAAQRATGERSRPDQGAEGAAQRAAGERSRPDQGAEGAAQRATGERSRPGRTPPS